MSSIQGVFDRCREQNRAAFIAYITAGDPNPETTGPLLEALAAGGADLIELGIPFSDPIADGPTNERAAMRALAAGTRVGGILETIARYRDKIDVPIVLFTYFNPIHARGISAFAEQAAASGVDGVLCLDLPPEEAAHEFVPVFNEYGVDTIFLLAPTSTKERMRRAVDASSGFVYYVSRTGVTGERDALPKELASEVKRVRRVAGKLPVAVGFGISTPEQVASVGAIADGVVVGSALVQLIEEKGSSPDLPAALQARVADLTAPLRAGKAKKRRLWG